ncbi:hemeolysin-III related [Corynebacterium kalinowskii]|uniref:Hemeolysin-III related n=1 Tax=Corynebacterium kalinowskii TaxID=2675216 RepID=A0A6B8VID1_9CORY|nr:hemolysin III family protein [Corynebacterium kalinowskii]QGU01314.1 hemeolysin-III related [Corynebacterium kalinowskii]
MQTEHVVKVTYRLNRGSRPILRGWLHFVSAIIAVLAGTILSTVAWMTLTWQQAVAVTIYVLGIVTLFGVSASYHLGPWRSATTVQWWRRADHATIAVFIAATYTPLCAILFDAKTATTMLLIAWSGAIAGVILNLVWINHPRWLDVVVYLLIGWLIVPLVPQVWRAGGSTVVWLLFAGGIVYTLGAIVYGFKWPGRSAKIMGFHEHFHTATVIAAALHFIAVCLVVA